MGKRLKRLGRTGRGGAWVRTIAVIGFAAVVLHPVEGRTQAVAVAMAAGKALAKGALAKIGGDAAGWVLGELGLNPDPDKKLEQKIDSEFKALDKKLDALDTELNHVESSVVAVYKGLLSNRAQSKINTLDSAISLIEPHWSTYRTIIKARTATSSQLSTLANQVTGNDSVASALDTIDLVLTSNQSGQDGLIEAYSKVLSQKLMPAVGDRAYYEDLHGIVAYYNKWRLRAVTLLVEAYHYQAAMAVRGSSPSTVCVNPKSAAAVPCGQAAKYAKRFFDPSSASPTSGVINQLRIAGGSMTTANTIPIVGVKNEGGVPTPEPLLVWNAELSVIPPDIPVQGLRFLWPPSVMRWPDKIGDLPTQPSSSVDGYGNWRFASQKDGETVVSAIPRGKTGDDAFSGLLPWLSGKRAIVLTLPGDHTSPSIWLREFNNGNADQCYMYYVDLTVTTPSISCGSVVIEGSKSNYVVEGPFGPFYSTCVSPLCERSIFRWIGPELAPVMVVTDASNCPSGQSGTNSAGWLKPCGNGWVDQRYKNELPSPSTINALAVATRLSETLILNDHN